MSLSSTVGVAAVIGLSLALAYFVVRRLINGTDPVLRMQTSSSTGSSSVLLSGTKVTMLLTSLLAVTLAALDALSGAIIIALVVVNVVHFILEKQEVALT